MLISSFYIFFLTFFLTSGFMVLLLPNPIHSLLFLIVVFINASGILLLFNMEFISLLLLIIYVGAISVLFLFMLMMMDIKISQTLKTDWFVYIFFCGLLNLLFLYEIYSGMSDFLILSLYNTNISINCWVTLITDLNNCETFGHVLYSFYLFFFLIAGLILLVALIGAVVLTQTRNLSIEKNFFQLSRQVDIYVIN